MLSKIRKTTGYSSYESLGLILWVMLCAAGLIAGVPFIFVLLAAAAGLLTWDWLLERGSVMLGKHVQTDTRHWRVVFLTVGAGLALAVIGSLVRFRLSFMIMVILVLAAFAGFDRLVRYLRNG